MLRSLAHMLVPQSARPPPKSKPGKGTASNDKLVTVFKDGVLQVDEKFTAIKERASAGL